MPKFRSPFVRNYFVMSKMTCRFFLDNIFLYSIIKIKDNNNKIILDNNLIRYNINKVKII